MKNRDLVWETKQFKHVLCCEVGHMGFCCCSVLLRWWFFRGVFCCCVFVDSHWALKMHRVQKGPLCDWVEHCQAATRVQSPSTWLLDFPKLGFSREGKIQRQGRRPFHAMEKMHMVTFLLWFCGIDAVVVIVLCWWFFVVICYGHDFAFVISYDFVVGVILRWLILLRSWFRCRASYRHQCRPYRPVFKFGNFRPRLVQVLLVWFLHVGIGSLDCVWDALHGFKGLHLGWISNRLDGRCFLVRSQRQCIDQ